jgi:aminoglycoside phosphotransferase (APT) family kinase protein
MGREVRIQRALTSMAIPVPGIVLEDTSGDLLGAPFYVMEKVLGHVIREELPVEYAESATQKRELSFALVDTLADLHAVDPVSVGLGDYGRPDGYLERQLRRWSGQWERSKTREVTAIDELSARLVKHVPVSQRASIVHGDYRMDNCLMHPSDPGKVAAVHARRPLSGSRCLVLLLARAGGGSACADTCRHHRPRVPGTGRPGSALHGAHGGSAGEHCLP